MFLQHWELLKLQGELTVWAGSSGCHPQGVRWLWERHLLQQRRKSAAAGGRGCAGWGSLWAGKTRLAEKGEKCGRVLTKKGRTEGKKKTSPGSKWAKGCRERRGRRGPWAEEGGCKAQPGKFGIDPWRNALGRSREMWGVALLRVRGFWGSGLC